MSKREYLVETLKRLGPEHVVDGAELCPQCDGLSPALGFRPAASGEIEEYIVKLQPLPWGAYGHGRGK
jgi:hypothetical protein